MADDRYFIEQRDDGRYNVSKPGADRASVVTDTQREGIDWVKQRGGTAEVERVRDTDVGGRDKWRKP